MALADDGRRYWGMYDAAQAKGRIIHLPWWSYEPACACRLCRKEYDHRWRTQQSGRNRIVGL